MYKAVLLILCLFVFAASQPSCRFANEYTRSELYHSAATRQQYLENVMTWEGKFFQGVGINPTSGHTYDGQSLNFTTGEKTGDPHLFSAASKESLHLSALAHIVNGDPLAQLLISTDPVLARTSALSTLEKKIETYQKFNATYPAYGGFFPWVTVSDDGIVPTKDWLNRVPSLDNGELIWALTAVVQVLNDQNQTDLAQKYQAQVDLMAKYAATIFYEGNGNVRTEANIGNMSATPTPDNYKTPSPCGNPCYLDDSYEGELFVNFLGLYGNISQAEDDKIWQKKMAKIQVAEYRTPFGNITTQKGWWFSAHEIWKLIKMPYLDIEIINRLHRNGEKARTWDAYLSRLPGMFASVNDVSTNESIPSYISAAGVQDLAFETVNRRDVITGYGTFGLFLADNVTGLIWFDNYLKSPKGQSPYGATEGIAVNGTMISSLVTWDTKITTVCAIFGWKWEALTENTYKKVAYMIDSLTESRARGDKSSSHSKERDCHSCCQQ